MTTTVSGQAPLLGERRTVAQQFVLKLFLLVPFAALIAAVPLVWGWA